MKIDQSRENMLLLLLLLLHGSLIEGGRVTLGRDGGYRGIVVNIGEEIPEEECPVLVENIKVIPQHHHNHITMVMKASMGNGQAKDNIVRGINVAGA